MSAKNHALQKGQIQLKRIQNLLGLRPDISERIGINKSTSHTNITLPKIDPLKIHPYDVKINSTLICLDIEAWEQDHRLILEVGIATLDLKLVSSVIPGNNASNWHQLIEAKHFLISENEYLCNNIYVNTSGFSPRFQYGTTQVTSMQQMNEELLTLFEANVDRKIILTGHDLKADRKYLEAFNGISDYLTTIEEVDSQSIWFAINSGQCNIKTSLSSILNYLKIPYTISNLHNAGNDSMLTLQAILSIALLEGTLRV